MSTSIRRSVVAFACLFISTLFLSAQSAGNFGTIYGTVTDPAGAVLPSAVVTVINPVSGLQRDVKTDAGGHFQFPNLPLNPYHLTVSSFGFATFVQDVDVRSFVPISLNIRLKVGETSTQITVEASDLLEINSTFHTDLDRDLFLRVPLESTTSSLSSLHPHYSRRRFGLQRPLPWPRRPRVQLLLPRRAAHHRPAEQGLLQPTPRQRRPVHAGHIWSSASRVWR